MDFQFAPPFERPRIFQSLVKTKELKILHEYYEENLCDKIFKYQLKNNIQIDVIFYREYLCHLLGIQHVFGKDKKYLGWLGLKKIQNDILTEYCQLIHIHNSGQSVKENEFNHLFDSFFRGSNSEGKPGNGLGLYIGRKIMHKMEGELFVEKEADGMSFVLVIKE